MRVQSYGFLSAKRDDISASRVVLVSIPYWFLSLQYSILRRWSPYFNPIGFSNRCNLLPLRLALLRLTPVSIPIGFSNRCNSQPGTGVDDRTEVSSYWVFNPLQHNNFANAILDNVSIHWVF